jgi:hypothetical protein
MAAAEVAGNGPALGARPPAGPKTTIPSLFPGPPGLEGAAGGVETFFYLDIIRII